MEHSNFSSDRMDWETLKGFILSPDGFPELIKAEDIRLITTRHHKLVSAKDLEGIFPIRLEKRAGFCKHYSLSQRQG